MNVRVLFFASLRESVGASEMDLELPEKSSKGTLLRVIEKRIQADQFEALCDKKLRFAVNQDLVKGDFVLHEGDEIAFLPPITGG